MKDKCCGNCKRFKPSEDIDGMCTLDDYPYDKDYWCDCYKPINNGWTQITPDNVDELYPVIDRVIVAYKLGKGLAGYSSLTELYKPLKDLALTGGYYFFILPELKIE